MFYLLKTRLVIIGTIAWIAATAALRFSGGKLLRPDESLRTIALYAISFALMAWVGRRVCQAAKLQRSDWPAGAISVMLPTLLLDPFSSAFFPVVFPNFAPDAAGLFGGWMLISCAGALIGVTIGSEGHEETAQSAGR